MTTVHLDPAQVPAHLQRIAGYSGRTFKARIVEQMTIPASAGLWDGGSRETYHAIRLADGASVPAADHAAAPWDDRRENRVNLAPGFAVVERTMFQGRDLGLTFYLHPQDAAPMLPAPVMLDAVESVVLDYTASRKASYGGKDRYDMYRDDQSFSFERNNKPIFTRHQWDEAKARLIARGLLNKAGAITTAGRNARPSRF